MCDFITVAVPAAHAQELKSRVPADLRLHECANRLIRAAVGSKYQLYVITTALGCSCSLYCKPVAQEEIDAEAERLRRKYAKKGWSQSKINRAMSGKITRLAPEFIGLHPEVRMCLADVAESASELAAVIHFYSGNVEKEVLDLKPCRSVAPADLGSGDAVLNHDEVLWVRGRRAAHHMV